MPYGTLHNAILKLPQSFYPQCLHWRLLSDSNSVIVRSRTNVHTLVFHLTIADCLVSFVTMPLEAAWRFTMQWKGDDLSCRVLMVVRALGYYLSSNMLLIICFDRS